MLPKVLIVTTIYDAKEYCLEEFLEHSKKITYPNIRHIFIDNSAKKTFFHKLQQKYHVEAYHIERGNNSREALARASNLGRKIALDEGYDYIFSLESDVMVPPDIIQKLMRSGKDIISGVYFIGDPQAGIRIPCVTLPDWKPELGVFGTRLLTVEEIPEYLQKGIKQVHAGSFGCCLIYRKVFEKIRFTYDPTLSGHPDIYFYNDAFRLQIPVYVDTDLICAHKNSRWVDVKDR